MFLLYTKTKINKTVLKTSKGNMHVFNIFINRSWRWCVATNVINQQSLWKTSSGKSYAVK